MIAKKSIPLNHHQFSYLILTDIKITTAIISSHIDTWLKYRMTVFVRSDFLRYENFLKMNEQNENTEKRSTRTLTVRNMPFDVNKEITEQAEAAGKSKSDFVKEFLSASFGDLIGNFMGGNGLVALMDKDVATMMKAALAVYWAFIKKICSRLCVTVFPCLNCVPHSYLASPISRMAHHWRLPSSSRLLAAIYQR